MRSKFGFGWFNFLRRRPSLKRVLEENNIKSLHAREYREIVGVLIERLRDDPDYLEKLEKLEPFTEKENLRKFTYKGNSVVIKDCGENPQMAVDHGIQYKKYLNFFQVFSRAVREGKLKPRKYIPVPIIPYGAFIIRGDVDENYYLVMQHMPEVLVDRNETRDALAEFVSNVRYISRKGVEVPQNPDHAIFLGNTNKQNHAEGKWLISPPHDRR